MEAVYYPLLKVLHGCAEAVAAYRKSKLRRLAIRCGADVEPQEGRETP